MSQQRYTQGFYFRNKVDVSISVPKPGARDVAGGSRAPASRAWREELLDERAMMATASLKRCRATSGAEDAATVFSSMASGIASHSHTSEPSDQPLDTQAAKPPVPAVAASLPASSVGCAPGGLLLRTTEAQDEESELDRKCRRLAQLIAGSKHLVAFTGAGISTSVGIPDYRGEDGIRTKRRDKKARKDKAGSPQPQQVASLNASSIVIPDFHALVPSPTHMALFELHRLGYLKHVVSQNVDNLHLKSGLPASALTEVHGNATQAICETCEKVYTADFPWTGLCDDPTCISTKRSVDQRLRARTRHGNGRLKRHVISFDEPLGDIDNAIDECEASDVALVLGTSLRVEPFSEMAGVYADALAIVNLQPTTVKLDRRAEQTGVRLFQKCDLVMQKTMKFLLGDDYEIPQWSGEHPSSIFVPEHDEKTLVNVLAGRIVC